MAKSCTFFGAFSRSLWSVQFRCRTDVLPPPTPQALKLVFCFFFKSSRSYPSPLVRFHNPTLFTPVLCGPGFVLPCLVLTPHYTWCLCCPVQASYFFAVQAIALQLNLLILHSCRLFARPPFPSVSRPYPPRLVSASPDTGLIFFSPLTRRLAHPTNTHRRGDSPGFGRFLYPRRRRCARRMCLAAGYLPPQTSMRRVPPLPFPLRGLPSAIVFCAVAVVFSTAVFSLRRCFCRSPKPALPPPPHPPDAGISRAPSRTFVLFPSPQAGRT